MGVAVAVFTLFLRDEDIVVVVRLLLLPLLLLLSRLGPVEIREVRFDKEVIGVRQRDNGSLLFNKLRAATLSSKLGNFFGEFVCFRACSDSGVDGIFVSIFGLFLKTFSRLSMWIIVSSNFGGGLSSLIHGVDISLADGAAVEQSKEDG